MTIGAIPPAHATGSGRTAILVTGGAGYIGSHTCKALYAAGYLPVTFDNLSLGHENFVKWGPLIRGNTGDARAVQNAIELHDCKAVMHFAAFAYVGESVDEPAKYYFNNVGGTLGVLDGMLASKIDKIVFSSTCAVYGEPCDQTISETTSTNPVNPYGRTKLVCEGMLQDYAHAYGVNSIALRYFNASGADPEGELGELRDWETHLIPRAMMFLQGYVEKFEVFGDDFPTGDGTAIRDYIHVSDLASAHLCALQRLFEGANHASFFNLGTGHGQSVRQVVDMISRVTGRRLPAPHGERRAGDPANLVADSSLARSVLGFNPIYSDLETIVSTAWEWHQTAHPIHAGPFSVPLG